MTITAIANNSLRASDKPSRFSEGHIRSPVKRGLRRLRPNPGIAADWQERQQCGQNVPMLLPCRGSRLPIEIDQGAALPQILARLGKCPRQLAFHEADLRLLINEDARHLRIDLRAFGVGQSSTGRCGKIGAVTRLLELCQVPITPELADRCDKCDGDGTLVPIDAGDAGSRSGRNLAALPFLESLDLLRRPPAPALCL
jgi:hypothetical protein